MDKGKEALLVGILKKSQAEIEQIRQSSEQAVKVKLEKAEEQCKEILQDAEQNSNHKIELLKKTSASSRVMANRKAHLECTDELNRLALQKMFKKLEEAVNTPLYEEILLGFLIEGTLALEGEQFLIKTSVAEQKLLSSAFFQKASEWMKKNYSRPISYTLDNQVISGQGLIIETADHSMLYDNTMNGRYMRNRNKIRMAMDSKLTIQEEL